MEFNKGILISIQTEDIVNGVLTLPEEVKEISDSVITYYYNLKEVVGKSVTQIGNDNFRGCNALTSVEFPLATQIGNGNFYECNQLTSVELPLATQIGNQNFFECNQLTSVELPLATQIGNENFTCCNALTSVELPLATQIGNYNFRYFNALTSVGLPLATQIGNFNFTCCDALTSVELPLATQIGNDNFRGCRQLMSVKFKNNSLKIKSVDSYPFVVQTEKTTKGITLYSGYNFNGTNSKGMPKVESAYVAKKDGFTAHGKTLKQAIADLKFKVVAEKLKKEPITPDTELTVMYYRTITGACDFGCREFMEKNGIPYDIINDGKTERTIEKAPIKAKDLLPILEKNNAYGLQKFKELIRF
jgi:hypothetical protein